MLCCKSFQSSPALSGRCNGMLGVEVMEGDKGFNPHRPFRAGATGEGGRIVKQVVPFQSSPALSGRCNVGGISSRWVAAVVSILTGPFGPVQPQPPRPYIMIRRVSILTGPFGPVQRLPRRRPGSRGDGFNPHRPFRAGATYRGGGDYLLSVVSILTGPFGPVQRRAVSKRLHTDNVSILTGPFGPVQHA